MALSIGEKAMLVIGGGVGAGLPPVLERVDSKMAIDATKKGEYKDPESFDLVKRPGIMVPLVAGPILLGAGILGDKAFERVSEGPAIQAGLLTAGTGLTVGGIDNLATALDGRAKAGVPMFNPDKTVQYSSACAYRSIGGPGYAVGCGAGVLTAGTPVVDPPYDVPTQVQVNTPAPRLATPTAKAGF